MDITQYVKRVRIDSIRPNPWNPNKQSEEVFRRQIESIRRYGLLLPILVRKMDDGYEIIDGEHRYRACRELGIEEVAVIDLGNVDEKTAKHLTEIFTRLRGTADVMLEAKLLKELSDIPDLLDTLPLDEATFEHFLRLADYEPVPLPTPEPSFKEREEEKEEPASLRPPRPANEPEPQSSVEDEVEEQEDLGPQVYTLTLQLRDENPNRLQAIASKLYKLLDKEGISYSVSGGIDE